MIRINFLKFHVFSDNLSGYRSRIAAGTSLENQNRYGDLRIFYRSEGNEPGKIVVRTLISVDPLRVVTSPSVRLMTA